MEQSDGCENAVSATVITGNTSTANMIPTENEGKDTNNFDCFQHSDLDGNAEATWQASIDLSEYCGLYCHNYLWTRGLDSVLHVSPGEYCHLGLEIALMRLTQNLRLANSQDVTIQLHVDGIHPLASSNTRIWTVPCRLVKPMKSTPFFMGVYFGTRQPENVNDHLQPTVTEIRCLLRHEVKLAGVADCERLELAVVVCDHPTQAFAKRKKTHFRYGSCDSARSR
ncbi:hypothetical protein FGIG_00626 [Fasciola gigantica]|uniref:Uncharacterized protein n=1 Tax=Fasciola gigantica TaxID=46835 RepID=A0A504YCU4_FASGI|nr:hypothetical protein FGIG_00626 [Fasciola gigantica]